jgi:hypothetical protein
MNTEITLLSDDALEAVSGGMIKLSNETPTRGPGAYIPGSESSGNTPAGPFAVICIWGAIGAAAIIAA